MKPFVSDAQRRWGHTAAGEKALGGKAGVHEWDEATKGKKLPERVGKSEDSPKKEKGQTYKDVFHGYTKKKKGDSGLLGVIADHHETGETKHLFNMHADCAMKQPHTKLPEHSTHTAYPIESLNEKHKKSAEKQPCAAGEECPEYRFHKSEQEIKSIIKKKHSLHSKFSKALSLSGETLKKYIDDNADLKKALEE